MGTYLIGSVPKMEINGAQTPTPQPPPPKLFWAVLNSAVCGENVNEKGQGDAVAARLIQNSLLQTGPHSHTMRGSKRHGPHVWQCLSANLAKAPASAATHKLSNQEQLQWLTWIWYTQVAAGFFNLKDKLDGNQI